MPGFLWNERQGRHGTSAGLALVIFIGTVNTFLPPGWDMWTTALSYFDQPWFYITGVVVSAYALYNLIMVWRFAPKPHENRRTPIW